MSVVRITKTANAGYLEKLVTLAGSAATLTFYTAPMPTNGGDPIGSATQLAQVTLGNPMGAVALNSGSTAYVLTFGTSTPDPLTEADGTATWARIANGSTWIADLDVTATGGGGAITMPNVVMYQGGIMTLNTASITLPI